MGNPFKYMFYSNYMQRSHVFNISVFAIAAECKCFFSMVFHRLLIFEIIYKVSNFDFKRIFKSKVHVFYLWYFSANMHTCVFLYANGQKEYLIYTSTGIYKVTLKFKKYNGLFNSNYFNATFLFF